MWFIFVSIVFNEEILLKFITCAIEQFKQGRSNAVNERAFRILLCFLGGSIALLILLWITYPIGLQLLHHTIFLSHLNCRFQNQELAMASWI